MGWITIVQPPHHCEPPKEVRGAWWGSVWKCDWCDQRWELTNQVDGLWRKKSD